MKSKSCIPWSSDAEAAVAKVPFFVRKRVRQRVEEEAVRCGSAVVTLEHVETCRNRYLNRMEEEVKGYRVEACFGSSGCPNRALADDDMVQRIESVVKGKHMREFLQKNVAGPLKFHHEFQVILSDCPNACSRPQIADIGLLGACRPAMTDAECSRCMACVVTCRENAIALNEESIVPEIDFAKCLACGQCAAACPTGALSQGATGYRIQTGGKLGRHPQLGCELPRIFPKEEAIRLVDATIDFYQEKSVGGERFGEVMNREGYGKYAEFLKKRGVLI